MSYTASETGRVKSIKSKFENLNNLESLDISVTVPTKYRKPSPQFLFKRSSTSIDLPINRIAIANSKNSKVDVKVEKTSSALDNGIKTFLRRHNNLDRTTSADTFAVKKRSLLGNDADSLKPLKEIKENVEVRLTRHINDPVKRSSIKRSPAFRVGDKSSSSGGGSNSNNHTNNNNHAINNNNNNNNNSKNAGNFKGNRNDASNCKVKETAKEMMVVVRETGTEGLPMVSKDFAAKFDDFLKRCDIETRHEQPGLTDTLKAFLKQPLPSGPPPKKPPRTFTDSPRQVQNHKNDCLHTRDNKKPSNNASKHRPSNSPANGSPTSDMKHKIDLLENQLVLKANSKPKASATTRSTIAKDKSPFSSSLLNCIPCSSAGVYDTMTIGLNQFGKVGASKEPSPEKIPIIRNASVSTAASMAAPTINRNTPTSHASPSEPIYMEPFAHLKHNTKVMNGGSSSSSSSSNNSHSKHMNNGSSFGASSPTPQPPPPSNHLCNEPKLLSSSLSNGSFDGPESLGSSLTSCTSCTADDHSITDLHDIHYMCTSIEQKVKSSDSDSNSNENDHLSTLSKTYDEINILVNAAFGQHKPADGMGNTDSIQVSPSAASSSPLESSLSSSSSSSQQKTIKLSRTLTEKRKDYVRRMSAVKQKPDKSLSNDTMHQTFKPSVLRTFSLDNTDDDNDETSHMDASYTSTKSHCASSKSSPFSDHSVTDRNGNISDNERANNDNSTDTDDVTDAGNSITYDNDTIDNGPKLFQVCLLIGFNNSTRQAYIKSKFPPDEDIPPNIEQLVFPTPRMVTQSRKNQDYSIILTDTNGYHVYGYCRRILPESCEVCLPLAYCIISEMKAPGFYFKILKEIETRHGQAEFQTNFLLQSLQNRTIPAAGKFLHVKLPLSPRPKSISTTHHKITPKRLSLEVNPKWLTESAAQAAFSNCDTQTSDTVTTVKKERSSNAKSLVQEFEEKKQLNNGAPFDLSLINRSLLHNGKNNTKCDEIFIRRPNDLRLESTELSDLYQALGPDLLIIVFSTLLLERNVILYTENISILSSCVLGLQTLLYPFQWQYTIVTILPEDLVDICQSPTPVLAGLLEPLTFDIEDGIVIDLNSRTLVQKCGDETTILPNSLSHSLKVSLEMVDLLDQGKMLSSVLIAEAFLRCFVELFVGYKYKHFDKKLFIESHSSQSYRLFLDWFTETAMFRHFIHQKFTQKDTPSNVDWMIESKFYDLFDSRILKSENESSSTQQNIEMIMKNCKVINKKAKTFKDRVKCFISSSN